MCEPMPIVTQLARRIWFLSGWARWLASSPSVKQEMEHIVNQRGEWLRVQPDRGRFPNLDGRWGILIRDDPWALRYQRLHFRLARARYAVGAYSLRGRGVITATGLRWDPPEAVREANRRSLAEYRERAQRCVHSAAVAQLAASEAAQDEFDHNL